MHILKYFHEEPAGLEILTRETSPNARRPDGPALSLEEFMRARPYFRGYLSATDLETGRTGASTLPETITGVLDAVLPTPRIHFTVNARLWTSFRDATRPEDLVDALTDRNPRSLIVCGLPTFSETRPFIEIILKEDRRTALRPITEVLDLGGTVLLPEPAHDGHDWAVFSSVPLADALSKAVRGRLHKELKAYVIPMSKARSEHAFWFERYDLEKFSEFLISGPG